jgi:hypothetical protein
MFVIIFLDTLFFFWIYAASVPDQRESYLAHKYGFMAIGGATMYAGYASAYPLKILGMLSIPRIFRISKIQKYVFDMGNSGKQFPLKMKDAVGTYKYVDFQCSIIGLHCSVS